MDDTGATDKGERITSCCWLADDGGNLLALAAETGDNGEAGAEEANFTLTASAAATAAIRALLAPLLMPLLAQVSACAEVFVPLVFAGLRDRAL